MNAFYLQDAVEYGVPEAVVLQQITFWIDVNSRKKDAEENYFHDNNWWMFTSMSEIQKRLHYFSVQTIRTCFDHLTKAGVLLKGNYNEKPNNRILWYAIGKPCGCMREGPLHFFEPEDVKKYGINAAAILWFYRASCMRNKEANLTQYEKDGVWGFLDNRPSQAKLHPYFTPRQIRTVDIELVKQGVITIKREGMSGRSRYAVTECQNRQMEVTKSTNGSDQINKITEENPCPNQQMEVTESANGSDQINKCDIYTNTERNYTERNYEEVGEKKFSVENSTTEANFSDAEQPLNSQQPEKEKIFAAEKEKETPPVEEIPVEEVTAEEILDEDKPRILPQDREKANRLSEMFYRTVPWLKGDTLVYEINCFITKYADYVPMNKWGPLVLEWGRRLTEQKNNPQPSNNSQYGTGKQQSKPQPYKSTWQKQQDVIGDSYAEALDYLKTSNGIFGDYSPGEVFGTDVQGNEPG